MTQPKKLQKIIKELRDSDIKMAEGDHSGFGLLCVCIFIYTLWHLVKGNILIFIVLSSCLSLGIISYYWVILLRARKSWLWEEVRREVEGKDLREMWDTCERGDWLLWLSAHMIGKDNWPTHQQVVLASCQCARLTSKYIKSGTMHPLKIIETTEAWAYGDVTPEHLIDVVHTAEYVSAVDAAKYEGANDVAYCAAEAMKSAAWAVYAKEDGGCFRLPQAASDAASHTAWANGWATRWTTGNSKRVAAEEATTLRECADIVRRMLIVPNELNNELPLYNWVKRWDKNFLTGKLTGRMKYIPIAVSRSPNLELNGDEIDNANINPALRAVTVALVLAAAVTLIGALGKNPIQYYMMLRWLTCLAAVMLVWRGAVQGSLKWAYVLVPIAIIFNPIIPIYLHGKRLEVLRTWETLDIVVAVVLVLVAILMEIQVLLEKRR